MDNDEFGLIATVRGSGYSLVEDSAVRARLSQ